MPISTAGPNTAVRLMIATVLAVVACGLLGWWLSGKSHAQPLPAGDAAGKEAAAAGEGGASAAGSAAAGVDGDERAVFSITYYGHACFLVQTPGGVRLLLDPLPSSLGYPAPSVAADYVLVSHRHFDHMNVGLATGSPQLLHGVAEDRRGAFVKVERTFPDGTIRNVASWHDESEGKERGNNSIFVIESHGLRLVHLGDLGHELTEEQVEAIGEVDVLLVPVGGKFTVDAREALKVIEQLKPRRFVLPMHYATPQLKMKLPLASVDHFLHLWRWRERRLEEPTLELDPQAGPPSRGKRPEVVVLAVGGA